MIIVSQNKESIINFNNVIGIMIDKGVIDAVVASGSDCESCAELGKYETDERAKEVLQEIIEFYEDKRNYECNRYGVTFTKKFVYEMPKE